MTTIDPDNDLTLHRVHRDGLITDCGLATADVVNVTTDQTKDTCPACIEARGKNGSRTGAGAAIAARRQSIANDAAAPLSAERREALTGDLADSHRRVIEAQRQLERDLAEARQRGLSWSDVGAALGISKQSAHQRYKDL